MSLKQSARDVLALLESGEYVAESGAVVRIAAEQEEAVGGTRLYTPGDLKRLNPEPPVALETRIEVADATTQVAARELFARAGSTCLLNFASARNPGGGFLNGAKAQEEDICRCSGLYPCLTANMAYYHANRDQESTLYTDHMIYSPRVPFFRVRGTGEYLETPFLASVITAPAPNTAPTLQRDPDAGPAIRETFARRWRYVLNVAADNGETNLLLGAWGCGAFGGDPEVAAETARKALNDAGGYFERVVFAIPGRGRQSARNLDVFRAVLEP